jgi:hypothetical protein
VLGEWPARQIRAKASGIDSDQCKSGMAALVPAGKVAHVGVTDNYSEVPFLAMRAMGAPTLG